MNYTVFGLGDTAYEQFNAMGIYFDKVFQDLGGKRLYPSGDGNSETQMTEEQFDEWKKDLWSKLCEHYSSINTSKAVAVKNISKKSDSQLPLKISFDCSSS